MAKGRAATAEVTCGELSARGPPVCGNSGPQLGFCAQDLPLAAFQGARRALSGEKRAGMTWLYFRDREHVHEERRRWSR